MLREIQRFIESGTLAQFKWNDQTYDCRVLDVNLQSKTVEVVLDRVEGALDGVVGSNAQVEVNGDWYTLKLPAKVATVTERSFGVVVLLHLGERIELSKRRRSMRYPVLVKARMKTEDGKNLKDCVIVDVSADGIGLICEGLSEVPRKFSVLVDNGVMNVETKTARRIAWMYRIGAQVKGGQDVLESMIADVKQILERRGLNL